jgi:hypothetical protein
MKLGLRSARFAFLIFGIAAVVFGGLLIKHLKAQTAPRRVFLGGATLSPVLIASDVNNAGGLPTSATITAAVTTSTDVPSHTIARIELTEDTNFNHIHYSLTNDCDGAGSNLGTCNKNLTGGGSSDDVKFTITSGTNASSVGGSVQFRVSVTAVTAPPANPTPTPSIGTPNTLTQNLLLTFQAAQTASCKWEDCSIYGDPPQIWRGEPTCSCVDRASPILIDLDGNGFSLTSAGAGVNFDLFSDGYKEKMAWTAANSDDAFLALDRNGNGTIDLGAELFGNYTPQLAASNRNGFEALAEFDKSINGGNGDGVIDTQDEVFARLRLWQDKNHNGLSEPSELHTLGEFGITMIELRYVGSKSIDQFGNRFRYRAKVWSDHGPAGGRWAWDVFFETER